MKLDVYNSRIDHTNSLLQKRRNIYLWIWSSDIIHKLPLFVVLGVISLPQHRYPHIGINYS